jgi:hypothetical protein
MLNVFITIDTEIWDTTGEEDPERLDANIDACIYGKSPEGDYGLAHTIEILNSHGIKATFFVETLCINKTGAERIRPYVDYIRLQGHDVQLHVHPEWLGRDSTPSVVSSVKQYLHQFTVDEQTEIIKRSMAYMKECGVNSITAFRSGNYGCNPDLLTALDRNGIVFDTSYNQCNPDQSCIFERMENVNQPRNFGSVLEFPVSCFTDFNGGTRQAEVSACSFAEMKEALLNAWMDGWYSFVLVSHSFELVNLDRETGRCTGVNVVNSRRFARLCKFLSDNGDKFRVTVFPDIDPAEVPVDLVKKPCKVSVMSTMVRYFEQFMKRIV